MLTRIEIDGFKTFENFSLDLGPFLILLGPNAAGKSNLFDAVELLSKLSTSDLRTAFRGLRGEPHELFRLDPEGRPASRMTLSAEVLVNPKVKDPWGKELLLNHTRLRYSVTIERRGEKEGLESIVVVREEALPILAKEDRWSKGSRRPSPTFRKEFVKYGRPTPYLTTDERGGKRPEFKIAQDGHQGRTRSAAAAEATILSSMTSAEFPHLFALREEMRSWRLLQLDPGALRRPSPTLAPEVLEPDGSNLPTVLARIRADTASPDRPQGALAEIGADLARIVPGAIDIEVDEDAQNREFRVVIRTRDQATVSSRVASDGTLRILALLTMLHDPRHRGLICFEEPENGVHPARLKALLSLLKETVSDPHEAEPDPDRPLAQMLLNSHSPVVLRCGRELGEVLFADLVTTVQPATKSRTTRTRVRAIRREDQGAMLDAADAALVSTYEVERYLSTASAT